MPGSTPSRSLRNCYISLIPMSERQQLKLVRQLETSDSQGGNSGSRESGKHRPRSRSCNGRGETPLHKAAIKGDEDLVIKLLGEGADPNTQDFAGWTPLHEACNHGWYGVALALVQAGASVNARGFDDDTPLHDAAINGHSKLVRLLVERGADVYSRNKDGKTPCDVAAPGLMPHLLQSYTPENSELGSKNFDVSGGSTETDNTAIFEMRRTPPQTKIDKSPRVTLRLHQIKKKSGKTGSEGTAYNNSRFQFSVNMEEKSNKDVYEFKSSKEATPVRGSSISPDVETPSGDAKPEKTAETVSTAEVEAQSSKRSITEVNENEENEDETRKKKRKEGDKESKDLGSFSKTVTPSGRVAVVRNVNNSNTEKTGKVGNQVVSKTTNANTQKTVLNANTGTSNADRKSPSSPKGNGSQAIAASPSNNNKSNNNNTSSNSNNNNNNNNNNTNSNDDDTTTDHDNNNNNNGGSGSSNIISISNDNNNNNNFSNSGFINANNTATSTCTIPTVSTATTSVATGAGSSSGNNGNSGNSNNGSVRVEGEQEEKTNVDGEKVDVGPKVPPLKIVIPQQSGAEPEQGNRNGKNSTSRHHQALPYVVSSNSNDSEKDGPRSRSVSPTDSIKSDDKKDGMLSTEEQKSSAHHQRVLRSAHRSGPGSNGESRSSDNPLTPRNSSNGNNGHLASMNSGSSVATVTSSNNITSGATTSTTTTATTISSDNPSPPTQNQNSPSFSTDAQCVINTTTSTTSSDTSVNSNNANFSNFRSTTVSTTKSTTTVTSNSAAGGGNEEKASETTVESGSNTTQQPAQTPAAVELHPRKRKLKHNKDVKEPTSGHVVSERCESTGASTEVHPHEQPVKNCYQLFLDIRKQIDRRRKGLFPVQPKPPQGFKDYLMNRCTYVLAGNASTRQIPNSPMPQNLFQPIKELFIEQEKERHRLRLQHVIEKEKLVLSVEQEILRVHGRAARALANQSLPFSACTILKDEEVYNLITPEQEEKDRNARSRYNGRLFLSWLQDVDDKWEKIKEAMLLRHHNEADSLHAVQKMDWEWKMKELGLCEFKSKPLILESHVPVVHVSDDFDLLPA